MSWIYKYTKVLVGSTLENIIKTNPVLAEKLDGAIVKDITVYPTDNVKVIFHEALTPTEHDELNVLVDNYETHPYVAVDAETDLTTTKQKDGFALFQRMVALVNAGGGLGAIDSGMAAYEAYFVPVRHILKDGFGEYALRKLHKVIIPAAILPSDVTDQYNVWIREFCHKYRPNVFADAETYDAFLNQLETEETI